MSKIKKMCAILLSMAMLLGILPKVAFAAEPTNNILVENQIINEVNGVDEFLMAGRNPFAADMPFVAVPATGASFYAPNGGTLTLRYVGRVSNFYNLIYYKILYLPADKVVVLQNALNAKNFKQFLKDNFLDLGIDVISGVAAKEIAVYLGVNSSAVSWLIGASVAAFMGLILELDKYDLSDAVARSTTGKIKIEYYYMQSAFSPYFQSFINYEPWNHNYIDVSEDYTYTWLPGVYGDGL